MNTTPILNIENLVKHFPTKRGLVRAVDDISFDIAEGDTLGLVGESGSGKTTTAQCVVGIYPPTSGQIAFDGTPIAVMFKRRDKELKRKIRIVFQDPGSSLNPKTDDQTDPYRFRSKVHGNGKQIGSDWR